MNDLCIRLGAEGFQKILGLMAISCRGKNMHASVRLALVIFAGIAVAPLASCGESAPLPSNASLEEAIKPSASPSVAPTPQENQPSSDDLSDGGDIINSMYRPGLKVAFIYNEELEAPYSTSWYGRLEKQDGQWRDVYLETSEKGAAMGVLSFRCDKGVDAALAWISYSIDGKFGDETGKTAVTVKTSQFGSWKDRSFDPEIGFFPPYEAYKEVRKRYC